MYCSDIDAIVCYACMCMDVCVVFYDCPVGEIHVVIQEEEERHQRIKLTEGSVCKASIAWDHPCYLFTFNQLIHIACVHLVANKDILDI